MKIHVIEAVGIYIKRDPFTTVEGQISDMLRYDYGELIDVKEKRLREWEPRNDFIPAKIEFTAIINSLSYTPKRWDSFGIKTRELKTIKAAGRPNCKFKTMDDVYKAINEKVEKLMAWEDSFYGKPGKR